MNNSFSAALRNADPNAQIILQNTNLVAGGKLLPDDDQTVIVGKLLAHGARLRIRDVAALVVSGGFRGIHWSDSSPDAVPVYRSRFLDREYQLHELDAYVAACLESNYNRDPEAEGEGCNIVKVAIVCIIKSPKNAWKAIVPGMEKHVLVDGLAQMFLEDGEHYPAYIVKKNVRKRNPVTKEFEPSVDLYAVPLWHKPMRLTGGFAFSIVGPQAPFYADQIRKRAKANAERDQLVPVAAVVPAVEAPVVA